MKKDIPESLSRPILRLISNSWGENKEDHNCDVGLDIRQWQIQGRSPAGPGPPLIFRPNWWGLNGQKKMSWETASLSKAPLSQGLDPALSDTKCVVPENIQTPTTEGISLRTPPPPWKCSFSRRKTIKVEEWGHFWLVCNGFYQKLVCFCFHLFEWSRNIKTHYTTTK